MKIRTGFVSNSSSSSFIVILPKHLGSAEAMGIEIFKGDWDPNGKVEYYDYETTQKEIADRVYDDYCKHKKRPEEERVQELISEFSSLSHQKWCMYGSGDIVKLIMSDCPAPLRTVLTKRIELNEQELPLERKTNLTKEEEKKLDAIRAQISATYEEEERIRDEEATKSANKYLKKYKEYTILTVEYSDNSGTFECILEHGDIFQSLIHERISKH